MRATLALVALAAACSQPSTQPAASKTTITTAVQSATATQAPLNADQLRSADFAAYPTEAYTGPRRAPDFNRAQRQFRNYHTLLVQGADQGPNFAGRYALVQIGCGAGCNETYQIDLSTGEISELHFADETAVEIQSRADSALLKTFWFISPSDPGAHWRCHFENYLWRDGRLASLGQAETAGACPDE